MSKSYFAILRIKIPWIYSCIVTY